MLFLDESLTYAHLFSAMESEDLLAISITVNICTVAFFLARGMIGYALAYGRESLGDKSLMRSLADLQDDESWRLPRFCLDVVQGVVMTTIGVAIVFVDDVIHQPFRGTFGNLTSLGYAIAIGCYVYRMCQDTVLHAQLKHFKVDLVHHLVAVAVCCVFLTYRQNALFSAIGLISAGSVPGVEVSRLLKVLGEKRGRTAATMAPYRHNLVAGSVVTFATRLLVPLVLGAFALMNATPLTMAVPVVAFFFTSLMFFGSINVWLCVMSVRALYRARRSHMTDLCVSALEGGRGHSFPTKHPQQATILAKKNPIPRLAPCANVNLAPPSPVHLSKNNFSLPNNYAKLPVNEALSLPYSQALVPNPGSLLGNVSRSSGRSESLANDMTVLPIGEDSGSGRPRAVRFLVPLNTGADNSTQRRLTPSSPTDPLRSQVHISEGSNVAVAAAPHQRLPTRNSSSTSCSMTIVTSNSTVSTSVANTLLALSPAPAQRTLLEPTPGSPTSTLHLGRKAGGRRENTTQREREAFKLPADAGESTTPVPRRSRSLTLDSLDRRPSKSTCATGHRRSYSTLIPQQPDPPVAHGLCRKDEDEV